jgi:hypothetical protein
MPREVMCNVSSRNLVESEISRDGEDFDRSGSRQEGIASAMARAALRLPSQQTMTRLSASPLVWTYGTIRTGRPESNSAA